MSSISQRRTDMGGEATGPQCITQGKILTFEIISIRNKRSICINGVSSRIQWNR